MRHFIALLFCLILSLGVAQLSYPDATEQDLDSYFFGGVNVIEVIAPEAAQAIHYQLIDLQTMNVLEQGQTNVLRSTGKVSLRFILTAASHLAGANVCRSDNQTESTYVVWSVEEKRGGVEASGTTSAECVLYPKLNWGHWTDIPQAELIASRWLPVSAFVPNQYGEGKTRYLSAENWLVLLVQIEIDGIENSLMKAEILTRIQEAGISLNP